MMDRGKSCGLGLKRSWCLEQESDNALVQSLRGFRFQYSFIILSPLTVFHCPKTARWFGYQVLSSPMASLWTYPKCPKWYLIGDTVLSYHTVYICLSFLTMFFLNNIIIYISIQYISSTTLRISIPSHEVLLWW